MAAHERIGWLVFSGFTAENVIIFTQQWRNTIVGYRGLRWLCIYWHLLGSLWKITVETLLLCLVTLELPLHGSLLGEDNEESFVCRGEELRFRQASCSVAIDCIGSVSTLLVAWEHYRQLAVLVTQVSIWSLYSFR